jgi:hypothetical protein
VRASVYLCCAWLAGCATAAPVDDGCVKAQPDAGSISGCYADVTMAPDIAACPLAPNPTGAAPPDVVLPEPPSPLGLFPETTCVPTPTLQIAMGFTPLATGLFQPYLEHGWAPVVIGVQGGIHVPLAFSVVLPGIEEAKVKLKLHAAVTMDCGEVAIGPPSIVAVQAAAPEFAYKSNFDLQIRFTGKHPFDAPFYCGKWVRVGLQVQDATSGAWGQVTRTVQLYSPGGTP